VATTDDEGAYFFWAPTAAGVYTITDAEGGLLGTATIDGAAMTNKTIAASVFEKPKKDTNGNGEEDGDFAFNTLAIILVVVVLILVVLMVMMMMKK
jgi:hypothetical protein